MIKPINNYILIEPVPVESFIQTTDTKYNEIGVVVALAKEITDIPVGSKVYFDSYMAKRYPNPSKKGELMYLINRDEVAAIDD